MHVLLLPADGSARACLLSAHALLLPFGHECAAPPLPAQNATYLPDAFPANGPYSPANSPDPTHPVIMQGIRILDRVAIPGSW